MRDETRKWFQYAEENLASGVQRNRIFDFPNPALSDFVALNQFY